MISLTDKNKKELESKIRAIDKNDELKVLKEIDEELEKLQALLDKKYSSKIDSIIKNTNTLYSILKDETFPLTESSRKWIVFGLSYLISDIDLIPDIIPNIGYSDDALVLQWVMYMNDDVLNKYKIHQDHISLSQKGGVLKELLQGDGDTFTIIIPGYSSNRKEEHFERNWIKKIRESGGKYASSGIAIVDFDLDLFSEFTNTMNIVDHPVALKPSYDHEKFCTEWQQIKFDTKVLGEALAMDIHKLKQTQKNAEIIVMGFNIGDFIANSAIEYLERESISRYMAFGGASSHLEPKKDHFIKLNKMYNFYSRTDHGLDFIYNGCEKGSEACGNHILSEQNHINIENVEVSNFIKTQDQYIDLLPKLIKLLD